MTSRPTMKGESIALQLDAGTVPSPPPPSPVAQPVALAVRCRSFPEPARQPYAGARRVVARAFPRRASSPRSEPGSPSGLASPRPSPSPAPTPQRRPRAGSSSTAAAIDRAATVRPAPAEPFTTTTVEDKTVPLGQRWCYVVGTVVSTEPVAESARSNEACVAVVDIIAPAAPSGVAALGGPDGRRGLVEPVHGAGPRDLSRVPRGAGRARGSGSARSPPPRRRSRDATAAPGARYAYTVTAVDRAGNESKPSAPAPGGRP